MRQKTTSKTQCPGSATFFRPLIGLKLKKLDVFSNQNVKFLYHVVLIVNSDLMYFFHFVFISTGFFQ